MRSIAITKSLIICNDRESGGAAIDALAPLLEISPDTGEQSETEHTQSDCGQRQGLRSRGNEASGKRQAVSTAIENGTHQRLKMEHDTGAEP